MKTPKPGPRIFTYTDYRKFLRDTYAFHKQRNRHFTFRYFSLKAGLSSPSALKEVMEGKKNLTYKTIPRFADAFQMNKSETGFFTNLVLFNQAGPEAEKNRYYLELLKLQSIKKSKTLSARQYQYFSDWYNSAIRELAATRGFKNEPEWIAQYLIPKITPAEARQALARLVELGLLRRKEDGALEQDTPKLEVDPDVTGLSIRNFNRSMIELGKEAIERFPQEKREISGLTLGVSPEAAREMKEMIREFKDRLLNYAVNDTRPAGTVYQFNVQFFPLSQGPNEENTHA